MGLMSSPKKKSNRKGNPHPKPLTKKQRTRVKRLPAPVAEVLVPKHLEQFCWAIFEGKSQRHAALAIGRRPQSGFFLRNHPTVVARLKQIQKDYQLEKMEREVEGEILSEQFVDENLADIIAHGEDGMGTGRFKGVELVYKRKRYIDPPNAQTLLTLQMIAQQHGLNGGTPTEEVYSIRGPRKFAQLTEGTPPAERSQT